MRDVPNWKENGITSYHKVDSLEMGAYGTPVSRMISHYDNSGRPIADHVVASWQPSEVNVGAAEHHQELVGAVGGECG